MKGTSVLLPSSSRPGRDRAFRRAALAAPLVIASAILGGCGSSASAPAAGASATTAAYPVTITNCGTSVTYTSAPQRAVSDDINTTEDMLALGLESRMVGTFGVTGDGPVGQPVLAQYLAGFHQVRDVSSDYFTKEELVGLHPDFLFAGWDYGLQTGTSLTPQGLAQFGIKTLALTGSCVHVQAGTTTVSIADTYQDLRNLGEIFNIRAKAQHVITAMQVQIAAAQAKIAGLKQSFTSVSWERVIKTDPQCIIISDYGTPTAAQKEKFLETSPITKNLTAVKNRCFLPLSYDEVTPGPHNSQAVVAIARWLHPAAFGLPADGS